MSWYHEYTTRDWADDDIDIELYDRYEEHCVDEDEISDDEIDFLDY